MRLQHAIELEVRVERHDDLVLEDALVLQVETRKREAEGYCTLRRRRDEFQREPSGKGTELVEQYRGVAPSAWSPYCSSTGRSSASSSVTEREVITSRWP